VRLRKLIKLYQSDPLSRWRKLRYATRRNHRNLLRQVVTRHGETKLKDINARTLLSWHALWLDGTKLSSAHAFIKKVRAVFGFGLTILEDRECLRIRQVMSALRFPGSPKRKKRITVDQAHALIKAAHRKREHSIALAQALQFELMLRQKDVIGEWVPLDEDVPPLLIVGEEKWTRGLLWEEIDADLVLRHQTSKTGKTAVFDLKLAPMVMAELARLKQRPVSGPIIVDRDRSGLPFKSFDFRSRWRFCARAAGVPDDVFNMDNRAGGISEAFDAGADPDFIRTSATHSELATTQGYNRGDELRRSSAVLRKRTASRVRIGARAGGETRLRKFAQAQTSKRKNGERRPRQSLPVPARGAKKIQGRPV
jgi:hypothetical protein